MTLHTVSSQETGTGRRRAQQLVEEGVDPSTARIQAKHRFEDGQETVAFWQVSECSHGL